MKTMLKTGLAALVLLQLISCTKENNSANAVTGNGSADAQMAAIDGAAAIPTIKIGTQRWMTKNLDVKTYRNGDKIKQVKDGATWSTSTTGAWCYYNNDTATGATYGKLYNWYAVNDSRGLAPVGFHIPTDAEWTTLSTFLGGEAVAGGKMKEAGTAHWLSPNFGATNSSGFTALPSGLRQNGTFFLLGSWGSWWSTTPDIFNPDVYWGRFIFSDYEFLGRGLTDKNLGYAVRCVKD